MNRFRDVKNDLIREWLDFREENNFGCGLTAEDKMHHICFEEISEVILSTVLEEDKMHHICFEEISEVILSTVLEEDKSFVRRYLNMLDYNYTDYVSYWNERYYRHGSCDALQLVDGHSEF